MAPILPWNHWVHKRTLCWRGSSTAETPWMGRTTWLCSCAPSFHHAPEERCLKRVDSLCYWKPHVLGNVNWGILDWAPCSRSTRNSARQINWSCVSWGYILSPSWIRSWMSWPYHVRQNAYDCSLQCITYIAQLIKCLARYPTFWWKQSSLCNLDHVKS